MRVMRLVGGGVAGAVLGAVGCFLVLNLIGLAASFIERPADEGLDTALFYWSILALPYAAAAGGLLGVAVARRRGKRTG